ncbi:hypothetical protein BJX99DRAFT_6045 [Aspergillus californicus]
MFFSACMEFWYPFSSKRLLAQWLLVHFGKMSRDLYTVRSTGQGLRIPSAYSLLWMSSFTKPFFVSVFTSYSLLQPIAFNRLKRI